MALTAHGGSPSVASLVQRALDRQANIARARFKLERRQIHQILQNLQKNNVISYKELVNVLRDWPLTDDNLTVLLEDCMECVVMLGPETRALVEAVCRVDWSSRSQTLVELYGRFLLDLVTAHNYHTPIVLTALLRQFKAEGEIWEEEVPSDTVNHWSNVHKIIAQIVAIMPMSSELLIQMIVEQYPYYKAGTFVNRSYLHNLIWISRYIPSLLEQIMTVIITRMIMMDVSCTESIKRNKNVSEDTFAMEVDESDTSVEDTMDYCMWEMLQWLQYDRNHTLTTLCNVFERVILPTHGIRHVQFLLLYAISISQQCADRVLDNLWVVAAGLHTLGPGAIATRRTAAAHLAGLLARCVRLPNTRLIKYLKMMAQWCHDYVKATQESTAAIDSAKMHGAFYSMCHAIFYLVAFKHQQLFSSKESINFIESLNLPRLVTCTLNPLRTSPPAVTRAFSSVTRAHQVVYCQAVIDKNARYSLQDRREVDYDDWFPYDPYTLTRSGKILWPLCIEYKEWLNEDGDDTQYSSRMKKLEADDDDFLVHGNSYKMASSLSNCISPGFKYM